MPSARRAPQLAVLAACGAIGAAGLTGCETTQEKAAAQQAESARILKARAKRQAEKEKHKHHDQSGHNPRDQKKQKGDG